MKTALIALIFSSSLFALHASAEASLKTCTAKKTQQMEITRRGHSSSSTTTKRGRHKASASNNPQIKIDQIDEWLWKNCRGYSEEMRSIEQQYM